MAWLLTVELSCGEKSLCGEPTVITAFEELTYRICAIQFGFALSLSPYRNADAADTAAVLAMPFLSSPKHLERLFEDREVKKRHQSFLAVC